MAILWGHLSWWSPSRPTDLNKSHHHCASVSSSVKLGGENPYFIRVLKSLLKVLSEIVSLEHFAHMKYSVISPSYCVWKL